MLLTYIKWCDTNGFMPTDDGYTVWKFYNTTNAVKTQTYIIDYKSIVSQINKILCDKKIITDNTVPYDLPNIINDLISKNEESSRMVFSYKIALEAATETLNNQNGIRR